MAPTTTWVMPLLLFLFVFILPASAGGGGLRKVEPKAEVNTDDSTNSTNKTKDEHDLIDDLFLTYNNNIRPDGVSEMTRVFFELSLFNLLRVDTKRQSIMTNSEIIMKWQDKYMTWDPEEYGGVKTIRVPYEMIWFPDIILQNTASASYEDGILNTNAIIYYTGEVELTSHAVLDSICIMDVQWYPFDQQTCELSFASWTYDTYKINLIPGPADLSEYSQNPEFYLEDFYRTLQDLHNPCCLLPVSTIKYHLQIQRRTIFSLFFFLMPGILINICALMVFSLPSESGEKVGLGINSMLAMMVFLMAMTERLPPTEKLPLAGVYYGACISMITFNICFTVLVLNLNVMGMRGYQVPHFIRVITLFTAKSIFVRIPKIVKAAWDLDENNRIVSPVESMNEKLETSKMFDKKSNVRLFTVKPSTPPKVKPNSEMTMRDLDEDLSVADIKDPFQRRTVLALESINRILTTERKEADETGRRSNLVDEWKFVSRVLDRTLFITFTVVCVIFNLSILTSSPFRERFSYCPAESCEGLTLEEILDLTANAAAGHSVFSEDGGDGGYGDYGGGAASAHLHSDPDTLVSLNKISNSLSEDHKDHKGDKGPKRRKPLERPIEEFPTTPEPDKFYVANPGPKYEGYEGLGLLPPNHNEPQLGTRRDPPQKQPPGSAEGG
ncbi:acetylcholine receptor subunit alpha-1-A-like [Portunus trituberculatus]|uniref:acetylcholine receptor subunit alpha-1-A-like n=1 Tax=Portunus trituberculatus TaxID=210409 RepID=UPI001E1CC5A3|nr:acetylcholine receptor subunit alpha-1-A-like [Portunus trituberculatus]